MRVGDGRLQVAHAREGGKDNSKLKHRVLDCVEELMIEKGNAAVTYRAVAARAGVGPSLVQYHFRTLDELLVSAVRRRTEQSLEHLLDMLRARPDQPRRVLWEFGRHETTATLAWEFSALGIHRESVRAVTVEYMRRLRDIQLEALAGGQEEEEGHGIDALPPPALLFLLTGIPKLMGMEAYFDSDIGHREIIEAVERYLDSTEPG
jgi:AcrR family transcriptional regulator